MRFSTRSEAGRRLADRLAHVGKRDTVVVAFPPGGVPVAHAVAQVLGAPLEVWLSFPLHVPNNHELCVGAVAEEGALFLDRPTIHMLGVTELEVLKAAERAFSVLTERAALYRGGGSPPELRARTVILLDDAIQSAAVVQAAAEAIGRHGPARIILASPLARSSDLEHLDGAVDEIHCLCAATWLGACGAWFDEPSPVTDAIALQLLGRLPSAASHPERRGA